jgi:phage terminase large subunit
MILIDRAQQERGKLISIVSETMPHMPHLKRGAIRDFLSIMEEHGCYKDARWDRSDFIYGFETGSKIEFFSADSPDKVRGPRRDILFINECNNVSFETYTQLAIRTNEDNYADLCPDEVMKVRIQLWCRDIWQELEDMGD